MPRRLLVWTGIALALAPLGWVVRNQLVERDWERRRAALLELALFPEAERRPWEVRYASLQARVGASTRFDELTRSSSRPVVAFGDGEARALNDVERVWVEGAWHELFGLDGVLAELRRLPLDELEWHDEPVKLRTLRECVNALCGRAWLAVESGDHARAAQSYADALRLTRAIEDGSSMGLMLRVGCARIALDSARSALDLGLSARELRAAVAPLLADWAYSPERAERCIRRELTLLAEFDPLEDEPWYDHASAHGWALDWVAPVERALALARLPAASGPWVETAAKGASPSDLEQWVLGAKCLHALHAQRNVVLTALAVACFREEHGAWPRALDEIEDLAPEHALDTLTGEPLPYSADESGARIGPAAWGQRVDVWQGAEETPYEWTLRERP